MRRISPPMTSKAKKSLMAILRWGVALAGTWYVLSMLSWNDHVLAIVDSTNIPHWAIVLQGDEESPQLNVEMQDTGRTLMVDHDSVISEPDRKNMTVSVDGVEMKLLGVDLADRFHARRLLVQDSPGNPTAARWINAGDTDYHVTHPHPRVQIGVRHLLAGARKAFLFLSIIIFPLTFVITSIRWHELLKALDIRLSAQRTFVLNMVGAFYNTFMPGSTGGDVLKAYYVAKQTHHRTRAVMSVVVDRIIGLLALFILGGVMAAYAAVHWHIAQTAGVAIFSLMICLSTAAGLTIFYNKTLRRVFGLNWLLDRLPMQGKVTRAMEAMDLYGRRPGLAAAALLVSFPVHIVVILSALLAGQAFRLSIPWYYYWTVVPVTVLAGSIPISPQGAGVMEYFAIWLLSPLGCTVAEAVALTMSIRLVQVMWNLTGGVFVLRGGYHAPTVAEEREVEAEDEDQPHHSAVQ
jgi:uncharacterized protein (TIRG00374 family)